MKYTENETISQKQLFSQASVSMLGLSLMAVPEFMKIFVEDDDIWTGFNRIIFLGAKYLFCSYLPVLCQTLHLVWKLGGKTVWIYLCILSVVQSGRTVMFDSRPCQLLFYRTHRQKLADSFNRYRLCNRNVSKC